MQKTLLNALCTPNAAMKELQDSAQFSRKMVMMEDCKMLPIGDVWAEYCRQCGVDADNYYDEIEKYENEVLLQRK